MSENWKVQVSFRTPAGSLINCRAEGPDELNAEIALVTSIAAQILATEQTLAGASAVAAALPLAPQQPQAAPAPTNPWASQSPTLLPAPSQPVPSGAPSPFPGASGVAPTSQPGVVCNHGVPAKLVPAGISKSSGKAYRAFYACSMGREQDCRFHQNA